MVPFVKWAGGKRQMLEQLVAKTGLPPFLLGLSWSSTERMSAQQAVQIPAQKAVNAPLAPSAVHCAEKLPQLPFCAPVGASDRKAPRQPDQLRHRRV